MYPESTRDARPIDLRWPGSARSWRPREARPASTSNPCLPRNARRCASDRSRKRVDGCFPRRPRRRSGLLFSGGEPMYEEYQTVVKRSIVESRAGLVEPTEPARDEAEETVLHEEDDKVDLEAADAEEESVLAAETGPEPDTEQIEEDDEAVETPGEPEPVAPKAVMTADIVADAKVLRTFLEQVEAVTDEAKVRLEPDGIHVTAVDPAHVQLVEITLPLDSLEQYRVFEDGQPAVSTCDLGLDVEKLLGVLRKLKGKVSLAFRFGGVPNERLDVTQGGSSREMGLVDPAGGD